MVGFVVVTHGKLADELISTAELIVGELKNIVGVTVSPSIDPEKVRDDISASIDSVDKGMGVLVLTDLFGGTPSNISMSFLDDKKVEVVTGVNLPMMIKVSSIKEDMGLEEMAQYIRSYGRENISVAGELLRGKKG